MRTLRSEPSQVPKAALTGPICPNCRSDMERASIIPGFGEFAHRIFACGKCGHVLIVPEK